LRKLRLATLFVVLLGVTSIAAYKISIAQANKQANKQYPAVGFTITYVETDTPPGGAARVIGIQVRYQKANGDWKNVKTNLEADGTARTMITANRGGQGVAIKSDGTLSYIGGTGGNFPEYYSEASLRSSPQFSREGEPVLGYKTFVLHSDLEGIGPTLGKPAYIEWYLSPIIGSRPLKTVSMWEEGFSVTEAVSITLGDPSDDVMSLPDLPISYEGFKKNIELYESRGQKERAQFHRSQLEKELQSNNRKK
jgi:hypothetical protein